MLVAEVDAFDAEAERDPFDPRTLSLVLKVQAKLRGRLARPLGDRTQSTPRARSTA